MKSLHKLVLVAMLCMTAVAASSGVASANITAAGKKVTLTSTDSSFVAGTTSITCTNSTIVSDTIPTTSSAFATGPSGVVFGGTCTATVSGINGSCTVTTSGTWGLTVSNKPTTGASYTVAITVGGASIKCTVLGLTCTITVGNTVSVAGVYTATARTLNVTKQNVAFTSSGFGCPASPATFTASYSASSNVTISSV